MIWRAFSILGVATAVLVGGAVVALAAAHVLALLGRRWGTDDTPMGRTHRRPEWDKPDDSRRAHAAQRSARVEEKRREAARIASGARAPGVPEWDDRWPAEDRSFKVAKRR
jgi:hypothetical protein